MMKNAREKISGFCRSHVVLTAFLVCLLVASSVFVPKMAMNHGLFAFSNDFSAQEIPFGMLMNEGVKSGALWNDAIDIGSNLIESFGFYNIGSPFFLLTLLFPAAAYPYLMGWLFILKFAVAGAAAALFMKRYLRTPLGIVFGAVLYAFSGFQMISMVFYHFQDVVAFFPLMLWALDELLMDGRRHLFAAACLLNAVTNPVFFFGSACFTVLYFLARYLIPSIAHKRFKALSKRFFGILTEAILGVLAAGVLLVPVVSGLMSNERVSALMNLKDGLLPTKYMALMRLMAMFLPAENMNAYSAVFEKAWGTWNAFLPLCGSCFAIAYAVTEKDRLSRSLAALAVFVAVPILGSVFLALNAEEYGRWYYMLTLITALASAKVFERPERYRIGLGCLLSLAAVAGYFGLTFILGRHLNDGNGIIYRSVRYFGSIAAAILMLSVCFAFKKLAGRPWAGSAFFALTLLCCIMLFGVETYVYSGPVRDDSEIDFTSFGRGFSEAEVSHVTEVPAMLDKNVYPYRYRFDEGIDHIYYNFAMAGALPSVGSFITTVSPGITDFYESLGRVRRIFSPVETKGITELLGGRYVVSLRKPKSAETAERYTNANGETFYLTENENALALGTLYDTYITASEFENVPPKNRAAVMLKTLVVPDGNAAEAAEILSHEDAVGRITAEDIAALSASHPKDTTTAFRMGRDAFSCTVTAEKPAYAFFAVPAEKYWYATVNGTERAIVEVNGLMAVPVGAGENAIVFTYDYTPFRTGIKITCGAAVLWTAYALTVRFARKRGEKAAGQAA